jgi:cell division protease FtsH
LAIFQSVTAFEPKDQIRYDELKQFVRQDRIDWVQLSASEIRGGYQEGRKPAARRNPDGTEASRPTVFSTGRVPDDDTLLPLLEEHRVAVRYVDDSGLATQWPWMIYLGISVLVLFLLWGGLLRRMGPGAGASGALAFGKSKGKVVQQDSVSVTFDDVAGVEEAKVELEEIIAFLRTPEKYTAIGAKIPKGVLLIGPPGTGKTLLARAVAGEAQVPFISISGSEFVEMFVGVGAARVRDLFDQAAKAAPCIVFIDELDALGRSRGGSGGVGSNEEREQTLNQLLVEMDGFQPHGAVIIMAATNRPEILDHALLRPGRFDRQVLVDRPDKVGREAILRVHVKGVRLDDDVDLHQIAMRTPGFAGADLANLVNEAALLAARRDKEKVTADELSEAIDRVVAGLEKKSRIITDKEKRRVAYHEVGHALAGLLAGGDDTVHKISIIPRGMSALGFTMTLPTEERYLMTETEIRSKLVGLLGGRAAEEVVFGEPSTGAQNDLAKATEIARAMVVDYGMNDAVGPVSIGSERKPIFLGGGNGGVGFARNVGDELNDTIDQEVRSIVESARQRAIELLRANREALDEITKVLLDEEVLEGELLAKLLESAKSAHEQRAAAQ